jgi:GNAT superfamily N-acetyltransferase
MVTLRRAVPADAEGIARVRSRGWQSGYAHLMPAEFLAELDARLPRMTERVRSWLSPAPTPRGMFVALEADRVVGFVNVGAYRVGQSDDHLDPSVGEVYALYVDPDAWGAGVGTSLLDAGVGWLTTRQMSPVRLWVLEGNARARAFYERRGFAADGEVSTISIEQPGQLPVELPEVRYTIDSGTAATPDR